MKAAVLAGPGGIQVREVDPPFLDAHDVMLKVGYCGICGSDINLYLGKSPQTPVRFWPGHEVSGQVIEVGKDVVDAKAGDIGCVESAVYCGSCRYCRSGNQHLCEKRLLISEALPGGFAEYLSVPSKIFHRLANNMSLEEGALIEPLSVAVHAVDLSGMNVGDHVAIIGAGTIGLLVLQVARLAGAREVFVSAKYEHQAAMAKKLGANYVSWKKEPKPENEVARIWGDERADMVIDTAGGGAYAFRQVSKIIRKGGKVVLVTLFSDPVNLGDLPDETTVTFSSLSRSTGLRSDYDLSIALASSGQVNLKSLITHRFSLDGVKQGFDTASNKTTGAIKVLIAA